MSDDMHAHRRENDSDDMTGYRLQVAAESTFSKMLARWGTPILLAVIGWFLMRTTERIEATQHEQGKDISVMKSDVRVLNTRLDAQVIKQLDDNVVRVADHERRLQVLERTVKTP